MLIVLSCQEHGHCPVKPASEGLHWLEVGPGVFELDAADLYCTGGTGKHEFTVTVQNKL
jgi:hypothetical protein